MADNKISAFNSATLPLAGTEVIPIVQAGETKKVSVSEIGGGGGGTARVVQWYQQGFRVYGSAGATYYGADNFPAWFNYDFNTGITDANLLSLVIRRVVWQAPYNCTVENLYFNIPENDVCIAIVKSEQNHTNDTLIYENTDSAQTKNIRGGVSAIQINEGDFVGFFVKRPDASPSFTEAQVFIDFKEVV